MASAGWCRRWRQREPFRGSLWAPDGLAMVPSAPTEMNSAPATPLPDNTILRMRIGVWVCVSVSRSSDCAPPPRVLTVSIAISLIERRSSLAGRMLPTCDCPIDPCRWFMPDYVSGASSCWSAISTRPMGRGQTDTWWRQGDVGRSTWAARSKSACSRCGSFDPKIVH